MSDCTYPRQDLVPRALMIPEMVALIVTCFKDAWDDVFLSRAFISHSDPRARALDAVKSLLALRLVSRLWNATIRHYSSLWSTIPADLSSRSSSLKRLVDLSGQSQLSLTLHRLLNDETKSALKGAGGRIQSLRMRCRSGQQMYTNMERAQPVDPALFMSSLKTLEVHALQYGLDKPFDRWIHASSPQLTTLRLTNFMFTASCALPPTLTTLELAFRKTSSRKLPFGEPFQMTVEDLIGLLSHLPLLETLVADIRYMREGSRSTIQQAYLPALRLLSLRACSPRIFIAFIEHIVCPALERAHLSLILLRYVPIAAHDFRTVSEKLVELTGRLSVQRHERCSEFAHNYIDGRTNPSAALRQTTVAAAAREHHLPLTDDRLPADSIVSTAAFALSVTYPAEAEWSSSVLESILAGLPKAEIESVTVHSLGDPSLEDCRAICDYFGDTRRLNWMADGACLASTLDRSGLLPQLEYLAIGAAHYALHSVQLDAAIERRKTLSCVADFGEGLGKSKADGGLTCAWRAPLILPEAARNVGKMFDQLLDVMKG